MEVPAIMVGIVLAPSVGDAAWGEAANIGLEIICLRTQAESVPAHVQARYYAD